MFKKVLIIMIIAVAVIGGIYFIQNYSKSSSTVNQNPPASVVSGTQVAVVNFTFNPAVLEVSKGDTVVWTNQDSAPHQITGESFESDVLGKDKSFSFTFNTSGTFDYYCNIHPSMKGKIIVK